MTDDQITRRRCARRVSLAATLALSLLCGGCIPLDPVADPDLPLDCTQVSNLFSVRELLDEPDHPCRDWVDSVYGRVARSGTASATVVTRNTTYGTGVLLSAVHTLGVGWFGPASTDIASAVYDPAEETGVARLFLFEADGSALSRMASPLFNLFNPAVSAESNRALFRDIPPREDFYFGAVDAQMLNATLIVETPGPLQQEPLPLYDPNEITLSSNAVADAVPGELALALGFPAQGLLSGELAASVAEILDDESAREAIAELILVMDEEGDIPYDAEVEVLLIGEAIPGMSGGGVFDNDGRLLGIIVRASDPLEGVQYIRAVRATFAITQFQTAVDALEKSDRLAVEPYFDRSVIAAHR